MAEVIRLHHPPVSSHDAWFATIWRRLTHRLVALARGQTVRYELRAMSERQLRDIGLRREELFPPADRRAGGLQAGRLDGSRPPYLA